MNSTNLSQKKIFKFWYPLAATWLMMAFEGPFLAAIIARLPEAKINLAAYGVAYSFGLLSEAPVIMMMAASTRLVANRQSYLKLRNFNYGLIALVTLTLALGLIPPVFDFITGSLMNLPKKVSDLTHASLLFLLPWPGAIAYRRFLQGILIANNKTKYVSFGTLVRLLIMAATAFVLFTFTKIDGALLGTIALSSGVMAEMFASQLMCRPTIKRICNKKSNGDTTGNISYKKIYIFYYPLALATFIGLGAQPLIILLIGHSYLALESLAVLPVINSLIFIFRSIGLSFQEAGIALFGKNKEGYLPLKSFATKLAFFNFGVLALIAFTPMADFWYGTVSGLTPLLASLSVLPTQILVAVPVLSVLISFQRSIQVVYRNTSPISTATALEVSVILITLFGLTYAWEVVGVTAAAIALVSGRLVSNIYLYFMNNKVLK